MKCKIFAMTMALVLVLCLLTGCVSATSYTVVNPDGSGSITVSAGFTKYGRDKMEELTRDLGVDEKMTYEPFTYNGVRYYGETRNIDFESVEEFNYLVSQNKKYEFDGGIFELIKKDNGTFTLYFDITTNTGDINYIRNQVKNELNISDEEADMFVQDMALVYEFEFPQNIRLVYGNPFGITVKGRTLKINLIEVSKYITKDTEFVFSTDINETGKIFNDVSRNHWAFRAIKMMAKNGLVSGVGNGNFNPDGYITYSQFAQIAARAVGFETGESHGYWAYKAIKSCLDNNILDDFGEISSVNYDKPMTREAAVAYMYRLVENNHNAIKIDILPEEIPDFYDISEEYRNDILMAYNIGITSGVDANYTFEPYSKLTRAQICQLFYNLGLYHPPVVIPEL